MDLEGAQWKESRCHVRLFRCEEVQFDAGHKLPGWSEFEAGGGEACGGRCCQDV